MNRYDIVFVGHLATAKIFPFEGSPFIERGGPAFFGPIAASCLTKRIATVTRVAEKEGELLEPVKAAGVDLFVQPQETAQIRVVQTSGNVDERQIFLMERGGDFSMDDLPPMEPCLIHLGGLSDHEFSLEFMRELKGRGFRLSVDMQSFLWQVDDQTQAIHQADIPEKHEILRMVDFVKLDVMEAMALTGTDDIQSQAQRLEEWGSSETLITSSEGVLARSKGKNTFSKFTNRNIQGRTGRGDTFSGAYLARRLDHSIEDSLGFATALTSIKMESTGPFKGTLEDVINRMDHRNIFKTGLMMEGEMSYTKGDLEKKLIEIYPEIMKYGLSLALEFDEGKKAWVVTFEKGNHQRHAYLDKGDADSCMEGNACIYLGVLIVQYIKDLEEEIAADK